MMRWILGVLLLGACGNADPDSDPIVAVRHVPQAEIQAMAERHYGRPLASTVRGFTFWHDGGGTIYIEAVEKFPSPGAYECILGHELRHVIEGDFHAPPP